MPGASAINVPTHFVSAVSVFIVCLDRLVRRCRSTRWASRVGCSACREVLWGDPEYTSRHTCTVPGEGAPHDEEPESSTWSHTVNHHATELMLKWLNPIPLPPRQP